MNYFHLHQKKFSFFRLQNTWISTLVLEPVRERSKSQFENETFSKIFFAMKVLRNFLFYLT